MLTQIECIPCILDDLVGAVKQLNLPHQISERILNEALNYLSKVSKFQVVPSYYITQVHRILKRVSGIDIPFQELRFNCNKVGIELAPRVSQKSNKLKEFEKFTFLLKWSIAGNLLDFRTVGTGYGLEISGIEKMLRDNIEQGLKVDHTRSLYNLLRDGGKEVLYILDNVGEIVMDKLLIKEIIRLGNLVTSTVRGGPITSDVTLDDAKLIDLSSSGATIVVEGSDTLGFSWQEKTKELTNLLNKADIIITKGQANFCVFSEYKEEVPGNIFCLFTTKCNLVSSIFGFKGKVNLAVQLK